LYKQNKQIGLRVQISIIICMVKSADEKLMSILMLTAVVKNGIFINYNIFL